MDDLKWWQTAVFYQIYPRSFADGNGDGIGDFPGITSRLDYLQDLGIDAVWLSPHFPSPQFDWGYDISDYTDVEPAYGTLDDFQNFLNEAHRRQLRVILDLVMNHTSHQHAWFQESRSSRDNPKRDWYIWRDGKNGGPPNNWVSAFGGPAWEYDPQTEQYYYHFFLKEQPDLNWRNPAVRQAMFEAVRFWLDMGVDGFRLDAVDTIFEDPSLPDHTASKTQIELIQAVMSASGEEEEALSDQWRLMFQYQMVQPGIHPLMQALREVIDEYDDRVLVGESDDIAFYGDGTNELHLAFNFPLMRTERLTPAWIRANQTERLTALPANAWPCNTLNNHDSSRVYNAYGDGQNDDALARLHLALLLTLRGTPFLYNGEEIGMVDFYVEKIEHLKDTPALFFYKTATEILKIPAEKALAEAARFSRDRCRTPMQWANEPNAGFSPDGNTPWLPVHPNYTQGVNVAEQLADENSLLNFYRQMLRVRRQTPALLAGEYVPLHETAVDYLAFLRQSEAQTCLVVLNLSDKSHTVAFDLKRPLARLVFSSIERGESTADLSRLSLAPFEIFIGEI